MASETTPKVIITIGIPGSGKTTVADQLEALGFVKIEADDIREELYGDAQVQGEYTHVFGTMYKRLRKNLAEGKNIVISNTNLRKQYRNEIRSIVQEYKTHKIFTWLLDVPLRTALERNNNRERVVPAQIIENFFNRLEVVKSDIKLWEADVIIGQEGLSIDEIKKHIK